MLTFFRKIRQRLFTANKFSRYLLYALGEIFLIVIGILIALQVNNWNTRVVDKKEERNSYRHIRRQIADDRKELAGVKAYNDFFSTQYEYANRIITSDDRDKTDTLGILSMFLSQYSDFHRSGNIYETLVNSGEIKRLKNRDITSRLQQLEMTYNYVNKLEDIHWELIINELSPELRGVINYATLEVVKPEKLYSVEIQNLFVESIFLTKGKDSIYNRALDEMNTIIELIDAELKTGQE